MQTLTMHASVLGARGPGHRPILRRHADGMVMRIRLVQLGGIEL